MDLVVALAARRAALVAARQRSRRRPARRGDPAARRVVAAARRRRDRLAARRPHPRPHARVTIGWSSRRWCRRRCWRRWPPTTACTFAETFTGFKWIGADDPRPARPAIRVRLRAGARVPRGAAAARQGRHLGRRAAGRDRRGRRRRGHDDAGAARRYRRPVRPSRHRRAFGADGSRRRRRRVCGRCRTTRRATLAGAAVVEVRPFPEADLLRLILDGGVRVQVRPSGTEPKVKLYGEAIDPDPTPFLDALAERFSKPFGVTGWHQIFRRTDVRRAARSWMMRSWWPEPAEVSSSRTFSVHADDVPADLATRPPPWLVGPLPASPPCHHVCPGSTPRRALGHARSRWIISPVRKVSGNCRSGSGESGPEDGLEDVAARGRSGSGDSRSEVCSSQCSNVLTPVRPCRRISARYVAASSGVTSRRCQQSSAARWKRCWLKTPASRNSIRGGEATPQPRRDAP